MRKIAGKVLMNVRTRLVEEHATKLRKAGEIARWRSDAGSPFGPGCGDEADQALCSIDEQLEHLELRRVSSAARAIEAALLTMEIGSYGVCLSCAEPIPSRRLLALPTAILCRACQEAAEMVRAGCRA